MDEKRELDGSFLLSLHPSSSLTLFDLAFVSATLSALPQSTLRRLPLPYELIKLIQSFVVGPRAIATHLALFRLNSSVRTYLFGQSDHRIEKTWKLLCLRSGIGQQRSDVGDIKSKRLSWKETATRLVDNRWGLGSSKLVVSWSEMETSPRWDMWNGEFLRPLNSIKIGRADSTSLSRSSASSPSRLLWIQSSSSLAPGRREEEHSTPHQPGCPRYQALGVQRC